MKLKELPAPGPRAGLTEIEKMEEQELAELQIESHAVVSELLKTYTTSEACVGTFIRWVLPQWARFWSRFQADGTMCWEAFEQFVQWDCRWQGDCRRVFSIFDPESTGFICKHGVLQARRSWSNRLSLSTSTIENFRWKFACRWGTLGRGWRLALDTADTGHCPMQMFMRCCHSIGMNRSLKTLWRKLTKGDISRSIYLRDLDPELDKILKEFALRLVTINGNMRQGWCAICRAGGGHLHEEGFERACLGLGMDAKAGKMLFAVLDPRQRRYLTEYDDLGFLDIWNPGQLNHGSAAAALAVAAAMTENPGAKAAAGGPVSGSPNMTEIEEKILPNLGNFEFELMLTKDEYSEYLRRRRGARIRQSLQGAKSDPGAETRRKVPIGGNKPRPPSAPKPTGKAMMRSSSHPALSPGGYASQKEENNWHGLAPNSLGTGKEALPSLSKTNAQRAVSSLGHLLSTPSTTTSTGGYPATKERI